MYNPQVFFGPHPPYTQGMPGGKVTRGVFPGGMFPGGGCQPAYPPFVPGSLYPGKHWHADYRSSLVHETHPVRPELIGNSIFSLQNTANTSWEGHYLDIDGNSGDVILWPRLGSGGHWRVTKYDNGNVTLQNMANTKWKDWYLDLDGNTGKVILWPRLGSGGYWKMTDHGQSTVSLQNTAKTPWEGHYLDIDGNTGRVLLWPRLGSGGHWKMTELGNVTGQTDAAQGMKILLDETLTYGWSHSGVQSWGGNWGIHAVNVAAEQIRTNIAHMVNLQQLEAFTGKDFKSALDVAGAQSKDSSEIKIGWKQDKSTTEQISWVNRNNFLIDVSDVRIVPETMWSKTEKNWKGERTWKASAMMKYRLRIWGMA